MNLRYGASVFAFYYTRNRQLLRIFSYDVDSKIWQWLLSSMFKEIFYLTNWTPIDGTFQKASHCSSLTEHLCLNIAAEKFNAVELFPRKYLPPGIHNTTAAFYFKPPALCEMKYQCNAIWTFFIFNVALLNFTFVSFLGLVCVKQFKRTFGL